MIVELTSVEMLSAYDVQPLDTKGLGPYRSEDIPQTLRSDYAGFKLCTSTSMLARLASEHAPTGWAVDQANAVVATIRAREDTPNRFGQLDRVHDLLEGAESLTRSMRLLIAARHQHTAPFAQTEERQQAARLSVAGTITAAIQLIVERCAPGLQNVVCRLPPQRRQAASDAANEMLRRTLHTIDRYRQEFGSIEVEAERWKCGSGVLDAVLMVTAVLFNDACKMADGITSADDSTGATVRANAAKAAARLDALWCEWIDATRRDLEDATVGVADRHIDLVQFGQRVRGVSDDAAAVLLGMMRWAK